MLVRTACLIPIENDFTGITGTHHFETFCKFRKVQAVRDDRADVKAALKHHRHLVPGLIHLPAVDAFDREAAEDHSVPVNRDRLGRDAEHRDLAAVRHVVQH